MRRIEIVPGDVLCGYHKIIRELPIKRYGLQNKRHFLYECTYCGEQKEKSLASITRNRGDSCGCQRDWSYKREMKGEKNNFWKGGRTSLNSTIRGSFEYKEWRTNCFKRDDYTCQISGERGGQLVVHHLESFRILVSDLDKDSFRDDENLFNLDNGITISKELHSKFHSLYGTKKFTKENFYEFRSKYFKN